MKNNLRIIVIIVLIVASIFSVDQQTKANTDNEHNNKLNKTNGCIALNYHRIRKDTLLDKILLLITNSKEMSLYSITDTEFEEQLKWLKNHNATFVSIDELIKYKKNNKFPKGCVFLNFDDMDISTYEVAHEILKKHKLKATGFIISSAIGQDDFNNLQITTQNQLDEMYDSGVWTYGSHTHNLHDLKGDVSVLVDESDKVADDAKKSKRYLQTNFSETDAISYAYPYGQYNDETIKSIKKSGFKYAFTLKEDIITKKSNDYELPRILVNHDSFVHVVTKWKGFEQDE